MVEALRDRGWARFPFEEAVRAWAAMARAAARPRIADPEERQKWLTCEGTWFVGVDSLPNDARGAVPGGAPLPGRPARRPLRFTAICRFMPGRSRSPGPATRRPRAGREPGERSATGSGATRRMWTVCCPSVRSAGAC